jgi:hypothetical protein
MTLESVAAGAAGENERGQHGQRCKDPLHVSLPSLGYRVNVAGLFGLFIGRLGRRLKGLARADTRQKREQPTVIWPKFKFSGFRANWREPGDPAAKLRLAGEVPLR